MPGYCKDAKGPMKRYSGDIDGAQTYVRRYHNMQQRTHHGHCMDMDAAHEQWSVEDMIMIWNQKTWFNLKRLGQFETQSFNLADEKLE